MNPGLVVKLRPTGPWRIGPDSGARNRVDFIYHSDTLYSAVASAMARLGSLDAWLDDTARRGQTSLSPGPGFGPRAQYVSDAAPPAVCFSSCFPFQDEIGFVVPPRTVWPPVSKALVSARVRWKSARFVPLGVVQAILSGHRLDDNHWTVDGASECLVPAGRPGPFRTAVRWSAAVDRLTGSTERHSTACMEFRPGAGLWTIVSFADADAHARWLEPIKSAFRLLADTGLGGERSRGWGRSESPEFIDGLLPDMILPAPEPVAPPVEQPVGQVLDLATEETASPVAEKPEPPVGQVVADLPTEQVASPAAEESEPSVGQVVADLPTEQVASPVAEESEPPVGQVVADLPTEQVASPAAEESEPPVGQVVADLPTEQGASPVTEKPEPPVGQVTDLPTEEPATSAAEKPVAEPADTLEPAAPVAQVVTDLSTEGSTHLVAQEPIGEPTETPEPTTPAIDPPPDPAPLTEPPSEQPPIKEPVEEPNEGTAAVRAPSDLERLIAPTPPVEPEPTPVLVQEAAPSTTEPTLPLTESEPGTPEPEPTAELIATPALGASQPAPPQSESPEPIATPAPEAPQSAPPAEPIAAPTPGPRPPAPASHPHWLLSLFTPAPADAVDWHKGNYTVLARGGRVDSPAGSGELKKQIQMVAEGSVVYAPTGPCGTAADVAPDGFAHPVFRAGFAVSIPLPEVS